VVWLDSWATVRSRASPAGFALDSSRKTGVCEGDVVRLDSWAPDRASPSPAGFALDSSRKTGVCEADVVRRDCWAVETPRPSPAGFARPPGSLTPSHGGPRHEGAAVTRRPLLPSPEWLRWRAPSGLRAARAREGRPTERPAGARAGVGWGGPWPLVGPRSELRRVVEGRVASSVHDRSCVGSWRGASRRRPVLGVASSGGTSAAPPPTPPYPSNRTAASASGTAAPSRAAKASRSRS
jgi:hypothetical protein